MIFCLKITRYNGIPQEDTIEMTGSVAPKDRNHHWNTKRVFYLTPQVLQNDLNQETCNAEDICCIVFDEAHKALGNHSYCQVIKKLISANATVRVLALSATPGSDLKAVQQVIDNLQIAHIELRCEDSLDIQQYNHGRKVEKIVVPLDEEILQVRESFKKMLVNFLSRLARQNLIYSTDVDRLGKFQMLQARESFRKLCPSGAQASAIEGIFCLCISLFHAYELLLQHGMRSFYVFLKESVSEGYSRAKMELSYSHDFKKMMSFLDSKMTEAVNTSLQLNSSMYCPSVKPTADFFYSHPKLKELEKVVLSHFESSSGSPTKVMIFSQYRESVREIADMLSRHFPVIQVMSFIGHSSTGKNKSGGKGQTQKEQIEVIMKFREGGYNTLVSTCVGEEGLDIGEVDLIVCFDAHKSPVRLIQRMGRTGRKRQGRIVVIVSQGKEEQIYLKSQSNKASVHRAIRDGSKSLTMFQFSPRMVPRHLFPKVDKRFIEIEKFNSKQKLPKTTAKFPTSKNIGIYLKNDPKGVFLTSSELAYWHSNFALTEHEAKSIETGMISCLFPKLLLSSGQCKLEPTPTIANRSLVCLSRWTHLLTAPTATHFVSHSLSCDALKNILTFVDNLQTNDESLDHAMPKNQKSFDDCNTSLITDQNMIHSPVNDAGSGLNLCNNVTSSQRSVPLPPAIDTLDWLDDVMSTQHIRSDDKGIQMRDERQGTVNHNSFCNGSPSHHLDSQREVLEDGTLATDVVCTIPESPVAQKCHKAVTCSTPQSTKILQQTSSHLISNSPQNQFDSPVPRHLQTPDSEDVFLKKLVTKRLRGRVTIRQPNFLRSPTPNNSEPAIRLLQDIEEADTIDAEDFINKEADNPDSSGSSDANEADMDEYDLNDDFINDKSVLTQYLPPGQTQHSPVDMTSVYHRSLISPCQDKYKLVLSQRHGILNYYMNRSVRGTKKRKLEIVNDESVLSEVDKTKERVLDSSFSSENSDCSVLPTALESGSQKISATTLDGDLSCRQRVAQLACRQRIAQLVQSGVIVSPSLINKVASIEEMENSLADNGEKYLTEEELEMFFSQDDSLDLF
ncbi:PREDICTED: Fanconi anemia group M protein isoform X2 [Amphimedon queenslandica]|uniref:Fanconi anemia group M protein n=1 Tax=Amphimedon queenslandica TaxID=400682 RepID=A0AAN0J119_AMPQE|nr:PREDICTED: Fanconi anemia group M protein isoform X2 [Amphimedon queenslandica]|eukprot:XP_019850421.1 PREDICTED: Fanconi anemia group M protein isoform X2 [Amphimedon queenslandica]